MRRCGADGGVVFDAVDDSVRVQAGEEGVARFPADGAGAAVGGFEGAVLGGFGDAGGGGSGWGEEAHCWFGGGE